MKIFNGRGSASRVHDWDRWFCHRVWSWNRSGRGSNLRSYYTETGVWGKLLTKVSEKSDCCYQSCSLWFGLSHHVFGLPFSILWAACSISLYTRSRFRSIRKKHPYDSWCWAWDSTPLLLSKKKCVHWAPTEQKAIARWTCDEWVLSHILHISHPIFVLRPQSKGVFVWGWFLFAAPHFVTCPVFLANGRFLFSGCHWICRGGELMWWAECTHNCRELDQAKNILMIIVLTKLKIRLVFFEVT